MWRHRSAPLATHHKPSKGRSELVSCSTGLSEDLRRKPEAVDQVVLRVNRASGVVIFVQLLPVPLIEGSRIFSAYPLPSDEAVWVITEAIVKILRYTGIRVGELCALTGDDIYMSERKGTLIVRQGKRGKFRIVPLHTEARRALAAYPTVLTWPPWSVLLRPRCTYC